MIARVNALRIPGMRALIAIALLMSMLSPAHAHLMVGQRGTLNVVGSGAFMVLSVPVSAFDAVDDDGDGGLSMIEFNHHRDALTRAVVERARLLDQTGPRPLQGVMLMPSIPDDDPLGSATHLVVMGRFALPESNESLRVEVDLFGVEKDERTFSVAVTRKATDQTQALFLTPDRPAQDLFPSAWKPFADFVKLGAQHIVEGPDHLLFLWVVLASGWRARQLVAVLTTFTIGHAITLMASVYGGFSAPAAVVEPAIAGTIVFMALFDMQARRAGKVPRTAVRLSLVFSCALVHGLGLAGAFSSMGLSGMNQLSSLAGFNVGLEVAQLVVALGATTLVVLSTRLFGPGTVILATRAASFGALAVGAGWFVQRIGAFA